MTREQALKEMEKPTYDPEMLKEDYAFVIKKLGLSEEEFKKIMNLPIKAHTEYNSYVTRHYKYHKRFFDNIKIIRGALKLFKSNSNPNKSS
mgnify:FL=1